MLEASFILGAPAALAALLHFASIAVVSCRIGRKRPPERLIGPAAAVTIIRPVCGMENFIEHTLESTFMLDHQPIEILFCIASASDPAVPLVERLMAAHPHVAARLLIGGSNASSNPKLNNMMKGWDAASHDWVLMADSNVMMPRDQVQRMFAVWRHDTGLVCSPPVGAVPQTFWAELECAILNGYQARWQLFADSLGFGFAQGKAMLVNRNFLNNRGGLKALGSEPAEDAAATKIVRAEGLRVRLVQTPFPQPLGPRTWSEVWRRQVRWGKLRRDTFPAAFIPELLAGGLFPILGCATLTAAADIPGLPCTLAFAAAWYGAEAALASIAGWPLRARTVLAWFIRDLILPAIWFASWLGDQFEWRGNAMTLGQERPPAEVA